MTALSETKRYQAYPEYKDSGIEWMGDIPNEWVTIPVGRLYSRTKRTGHSEKELLSVYRDYGVIPKSSRDDNNNKESDDLTPYQLVQPNDLVMNKMKAWQGSIAVSEYEGIVSPAYFVYEPREKLFELAHPRYVHYLLRNPIYITQYMSRSKGIRVNQWDLDPDEFKTIELLLPSKDEQNKIFEFLDHETAKIDTLIEKQQQLIKLLKEKRQAVISHAVTKGLNPQAPMKDSGVEWLGEVPKHWVSTPLKHYAKVIDCKHITAEFTDDGFPLASISEVKGWSVDLSRAKYTSKKYYDALIEGGRKPLAGDIIYSRNATVGEAALVLPDMPEFAMGQDVCLIRLLENVNSEYLLYVLNSGVIENQLSLAMVGSTFKRINVDNIRNFLLALPPLSEQEQINESLSNLTNKYDLLIDKASVKINLMKERRTALISAAVTGKIDVRNWQAPTPQNQTLEQTA
ncbi:restriction endonuclease subunit S [Photobacterium salinisoli]|uniref:restriction endonuclease subunit S n=1 Tax=Photobacterium salinisoli TaxID=1616783 RepID=UPI000EA30B1D|nr:restriction endonuclease subunit S [Photobacterium salinisoli]